MSLFTEVAGLVLRGGPTGEFDEDGNPIYAPARTVESPAWWEPRESGEDVNAKDQITSGFWLYLPEHTDLTAVDAVKIPFDGPRYEVVGDPGRQPGGFIVEGFVKTAVELVKG